MPDPPPIRRYVVLGAGAIGATIGGRLHAAGHDVVLVARGTHLDALRTTGLRLQTPAADDLLAVPATDALGPLGLGAGDVVILAVKGQDTPGALDDLAESAAPDITVVCAQNGIDNERQALRRFADVQAMVVWMPCQLLDPGVVQVFSSDPLGVLDLGCFPQGADGRSEQVASDLRTAGFASLPDAEVMTLKYAKLLANLGNATQAALGPDADADDLRDSATAEGTACLRAIGVDVDAARAAMRERASALGGTEPVRGRSHAGGSTWQSVRRGSGRVEADSLNGEICLLGRLHSVPTPINAALQRAAWQVARSGATPGELSRAQLGLPAAT